MIQINIASLNSELKQGLILLCEDYDFALSDTEGLQLFAEHTGENLVQVFAERAKRRDPISSEKPFFPRLLSAFGAFKREFCGLCGSGNAAVR